ncbi:MMPL family transporter [Komagataeibacter oboediens]|uniref:MMPL family transporter n=1 Tax=Komagataeibacter oboediens TaxID=65958 RepID=A0ABS5SJN0_9PROT|nr:MMPL family transporter [Komagataeibacter oboediens]MBL7234581.1 MMPL family transporter [Komagataeibacter oboediens]MBT0674441.1 MMPL family transporter [Komagataeibacter oboediens]MBT0678092.1 MMPL family transporter [Komagataeibacter oboediens]
MLSVPLGRLVAFCSRRAIAVVLVFAFLIVGATYASYALLGVTTDTGTMFSASLDWKKRSDEMGRLFPQKQDQLVAVIDAALPEEAQQTALALAAKLRDDHAHFNYVTTPQTDPYLVRNGLMFLDAKALERVLNTTITAQPFLSELAADPSGRGLFNALNLIALGISQGQADLGPFHAALDGFATTLQHSVSGTPEPLSWERLLAGDLADLGGKYQFVVTQPKLDYDSFQPGGAASDAIRNAANSLPFVQSGRAHVHITGDTQIADEEFATVAEGMVAGLLGSLVLVSLWLILAVHTWRIIIPIIITLVSGLLLTTGFAAIVVGKLNLISVAFAILFVGIAVDFAIQFSVRFRAQALPDGSSPGLLDALEQTGNETGHQILVAAMATSAGFLAFTPTAFVGVAQLGLIAGFGMLFAFICTLTLLPALLRLFRPTSGHGKIGFAFARPVDVAIRHHRKPILGVFVVIALVGVALVPRLTFDADPLHTKNPKSEGMVTLGMLMSEPQYSPYTVDVLMPNLDQAAAMSDKLSSLPMVHDALWLGSLVPAEQKDKLPLIQDAANIMLPTLLVPNPAPAPDADALRTAAAKTAAALGGVMDKLPADDPLRRIQSALAHLSQADDQRVLATNEALVRFLPMQLNMLRDMLQVKPVAISDVPAQLAHDYLLPDGRALVEVHPTKDMKGNRALHTYVEEIQKVAPMAAGSAIDIVQSAATMVHAFVTAAAAAIVMIAIILAVALRKLLDTALVLAPLLLSALMTVILIIVVPEQLNFANIIALPLLLGVGVSFNIYFVMNWRAGIKLPLSSPTARAVLFSALTTGTAFGSLAASHHPGTASMGRLLLLSLACTLVATLVFVPALLPKRPIDEE